MISVHNLSLKIGKNQILKEISFDVNKGEVLSIIGPNGAGKSTMIKCLNLINDDFFGEVLYNNEDIKGYETKEIAKIFSYVSQDMDSNNPFSVKELMHLSRYPFMNKYRSLEIEEIRLMNHYLEKLDVAHLIDRSINELSGGERQRVFVSSSLFQGSEVILLDEPTSSLDPKHHQEILDVILEEKKEGKTIIMVSHDINSSCHLSDKVLGLKNGEVQFLKEGKGLLKTELVDDLFDFKFTKLNHENEVYVIKGRAK
ncbi:ABC transporter ATP-binding protein [Halobacteriovorax sp. GB3]|uniref:ABC transporter ATP-binding protein n=1 Tax=Halobacteriovorax sp. GB3 TaxID=2719615 RepID=UPI00235F789A|nr:ABC transporter ATP-binding protein [Halobacteriovorax sp. GB3]MDD0852454.1 ABC transporter ATP-binding protein [Halobacteriovorax sp. GB3]